MSQQNLSTTAASFAAPADLFATLTVGGTTANLTNVLVGEKVTCAGGGTGRVSGFGPDANTIRVKGAKGAISTWTGALTFGTSAAASMTASSFAYINKLKRINSSTGSVATVTEYTYTVTDRGFEIDKTARATARATEPKQVFSAVRMAVSKSQNTDESVVPTYAYTAPANGNYSKAATPTLRFKITSNEALNVVGTPTLALLFFGSQAKNATYNAALSDSMNHYFDYTLDGTTATGAMVSAGAVSTTTNYLVDAGDSTPSALTITWSGSVTSINVTA